MFNNPGHPTSTTSLEHALATESVRRRGRPQRKGRISPLVVASIAGAVELVAVSLSGLLTAIAWLGTLEAASNLFVAAILATALAGAFVSERLGLYSVSSLRSPLRSLWQIVMAWASAIGLLLGAVFLLKVGHEFSRAWLMLWLPAGLVAILCCRVAARAALHHLSDQGRLNRRAVVFGAGEAGASLVAQLEADANSDVRIAGVFDDRGGDRIPDSLSGYPLLGNVDQLVAFCRSNDIDLLILSLPVTAERRLLEILKKIWVLPVDIRLAAHTGTLRLSPRAYSHVGSVPLLDILDRPLDEWDQLVKATFDRVVAFVRDGGYALKAYERFAKIRADKEGRLRVANARLAQAYRMNIGTIVESTMLKVHLGSARGGALRAGVAGRRGP
jgi:FlaA1/EpsC-like NDP-sugar epimerase